MAARSGREPATLYQTTIGKKIAMAVAGLVLFGYLLLHLAGNLKAFTGEQHFNEYSEFLRTFGAPIFGYSQFLWLVRIILLAALLVHVVAFLQLWAKSRAARRVGYRKYQPEVFSRASRTMKWGGIAILLFVIYHILHLTTGDVHPTFEAHQAYRNMVSGFQSPLPSIIYTIGMIAVGLHLYHGLWSVFQTMGWNNKNWNRLRRPVAVAFALVITLGFMSVPFGVWTGILDEPGSAAATHAVAE
ncbi:MAG TPA: succinate dehydrogenase cytochrome b subunit [Longimicrobiales bacterium]